MLRGMDDAPDVTITFRIPGTWETFEDFRSALPDGCEVEEVKGGPRDGGADFILPSGERAELYVLPADEQFFGVFMGSVRNTPSAEEEDAVRNFTANVCLNCPGGSPENAATAMFVAAHAVDAGGAGVFLDVSGVAHGAGDWLGMAADMSLDALTFAYVGLMGGGGEVTTIGMHVFGRPDFVMKEADAGQKNAEGKETIIETMKYLAGTDRQFEAGHVLMVREDLSFRVSDAGPGDMPPDTPMFNPFGRVRLTSLRDIAESN